MSGRDWKSFFLGFFYCRKLRNGEALLEVQLFEREVSLHNASGLDTSSQHVLLSGDVIRFGYPLQIVQVTTKES